MSNLNPLLTVIVPVYKVEKYLEECLNSITSQTYRNLEIILVDDKSPDKCPAMCDSWAERDSRIRVIHKDKNEGLSEARNEALPFVTGDYITFVDSDDYLDLSAYEKMIAAAVKYEADVVFQGVNIQQPDGSFTKRVFGGHEVMVYRDIENAINDITPGFIPDYAVLSVWAAIYRKEYSLHPFTSTSVAASEDFEWNLKMLSQCKKVCRIPFAGYYYRLTSGSLTKEIDINKPTRVLNSAKNGKFIEKYLNRPDLIPTYTHNQMIYFQRFLFNKGVPMKITYAGIKNIVKNKEYQNFIAESANIKRSGMNENLVYWSHRSGNPILAYLYGWFDRRVACDKLGLSKKKS